MTRKEELTEKVRKILSALELRTQDQASLYLVDELLQVEYEIWEKMRTEMKLQRELNASSGPDDRAASSVSAVYECMEAWCRQQQKEVEGCNI